MADTFVKIATVTVGAGGAATMAFTSIPQTYTDLLIKVSQRGAASANGSTAIVTFNGSTSSYSERYLQGNGTSASSGTNVFSGAGLYGLMGDGALLTANTFGNSEIYIPNYTGSTYKSTSSDGTSENNATLSYTVLNAGLWSNTAAITSITLTSDGTTFVQYSTATLYGIKNS
jgi:hypothetical protein